MCVSEENVGYDVWRVAVDSLVEKVAGVWKCSFAIPAAGNVWNDPYTLTGILGFLELGYEPMESSRVVWVNGIDKVKIVARVPKVWNDRG